MTNFNNNNNNNKANPRIVREHLLNINNSLMSLKQILIELKNTGLKVQWCELYNNKYMIALTQITNTETFTFIAVVAFKLLSRKALFINKRDNRHCGKVGYFLRK